MLAQHEREAVEARIFQWRRGIGLNNQGLKDIMKVVEWVVEWVDQCRVDSVTRLQQTDLITDVILVNRTALLNVYYERPFESVLEQIAYVRFDYVGIDDAFNGTRPKLPPPAWYAKLKTEIDQGVAASRTEKLLTEQVAAVRRDQIRLLSDAFNSVLSGFGSGVLSKEDVDETYRLVIAKQVIES